MEHRPALLWATPSIDFALGRGRRKLLTVMQGIRDTVGVCQDALPVNVSFVPLPAVSSLKYRPRAGFLSSRCFQFQVDIGISHFIICSAVAITRMGLVCAGAVGRRGRLRPIK